MGGVAVLAMTPYYGGKQRLVPALLSRLPSHRVYVEALGGSGALLLSKLPVALEVYNDLNGDLVNLFEVVRSRWDAFSEQVEGLLHSRQLFREWQWEYLRGSLPPDPVERAVRTWYVFAVAQAARPGSGYGHVTRPVGNDALTLRTLKERLQQVHRRLSRVQVENLPWQRVVEKYDQEDALFYLDPPYLETHPGYRYEWNKEHYLELALVLRRVVGRWILTVGDHPFLRRLFQDYTVEGFTTGQSASVYSTTGPANNAKPRGPLTQLIIRNYGRGP